MGLFDFGPAASPAATSPTGGLLGGGSEGWGTAQMILLPLLAGLAEYGGAKSGRPGAGMNMITGLLKMQQDQQDREEKKQATQVMGQAMGLLNGKPAEAKTYGDGTTINWNEQAPNRAAAMEALASNPYTMSKAFDLIPKPKDLMEVDGRVFDPNTRKFITEKAPEFSLPGSGSPAPSLLSPSSPTQTVPKGDPSSVPMSSLSPELDMLTSAAEEKYNLPSGSLRSLIGAESGGRQGVISPKGAIGLAQLMPGTAKDLGVDPNDPRQNIDGGARYFSQMLQKYGNVDHALAAYNWGPGNMDMWLKSGGDPSKLPQETRQYVDRVKGGMGMGGAPVQVAQADTGTMTDAAPTMPGMGPQGGRVVVVPSNKDPTKFAYYDTQMKAWLPPPEKGFRYGANGTMEPDQGWLNTEIQLRRAGKPETNVTVNGDNAMQKGLGEGIAKDVMQSREQADAASKQISAIGEARNLLDSGVITGAGANWKTALQKGLSGVGLIDGKNVPNTEAFVAAMGQQTMALVKNLGAGAGISNADRDFAAQVAGGNIELTEPGIRRILDINERAARAAITKHNGNVGPIVDDPNTPASARAYLRVPEPPQYQRQGAVPGTPDRSAVEAELRRRGVLK